MANVRWIPDQEYKPQYPFRTRANAGEVIPEPPSPAGWDLVWDKSGCVAGWYDCAVNRLGIGREELDPNPDNVEWIGLIGGYAYLSATWIRVWGERTPGLSAAAIDQAYFGEHPDVPVYKHEPWHDNPHTTEAMVKWLGRVMGDMDQSELEDSRLAAHAIRAARPNFATMTDPDLLAYAIKYRPMCRTMFDQHINQSAAAAIGPGAIGAICAAVGRPDAAMQLLAGFGDVDSAVPSYAMWDLSRRACASRSVNALFEAGPTGLNARLRASTEPEAVGFCRAFDEFLAEFGSRGPNEWDLMAETWETQPDLALTLVDRMRVAPDEGSPRKNNAEREAQRKRVEEEVAALLSGDADTLAQFRAACASAHTYVPGRERSKTNIIRVIEEQRMAMRELGRRAVGRGDVATPPDMCLLFEDELQSYCAGTLAGVRELTAARKAHHDWLLTLEPPFILNGPPTPNTTWPKRADRVIEKVLVGQVLHGAPGCSGVVRGRARVVHTPADPTLLEPGDILIAPMTDPAWTPLFVPAAGVIVDVGAALSHAIIVSRELGIPCVVSVTGASQRIPDGAIVEVNGDAGTVTIIELP